jgi:hypothetical protein
MAVKFRVPGAEYLVFGPGDLGLAAILFLLFLSLDSSAKAVEQARLLPGHQIVRRWIVPVEDTPKGAGIK